MLMSLDALLILYEPEKENKHLWHFLWYRFYILFSRKCFCLMNQAKTVLYKINLTALVRIESGAPCHTII